MASIREKAKKTMASTRGRAKGLKSEVDRKLLEYTNAKLETLRASLQQGRKSLGLESDHAQKIAEQVLAKAEAVRKSLKREELLARVKSSAESALKETQKKIQRRKPDYRG